MWSFFRVRRHMFMDSFVLLLLRIAAGLAFAYHGWPKIHNPFSWMGASSALPAWVQVFTACAEFLGGLAWILGFLNPLASLAMMGSMAGAVCMHVFIWGDPFVAKGSSYEIALIYFLIASVFFVFGPGTFSLDHILFGKRHQKY